jgi:hypothetical protein
VSSTRRSALLVAVLAFLVFLPSVYPGELLCYDDDHYIPGSPAVRECKLAQMLDPRASRADLGAEYLPVRDLTYALDAQLWGEHTPHGLDLTTTRTAVGFRLTNLALYALACALACVFVEELTGDPLLAFLSAAFFAVHPVHAESAAWVASRKDVLSGALGFGALVVYVRARRTKGAWGKHALAVFLGFLAMLSKSTLTALPLLVALVEVAGESVRRERTAVVGGPPPQPSPASRGREFALVLPHFLVALAVSANAVIVGRSTGIAKPRPPGGLETILATDLLILARYLSVSFAPAGLRVSYARIGWHFSFADPLVLASAAVLLLATGLAVRAAVRGPKLVAFAAAWFLLALVPVLNFVPFVQIVADRYMFVPVLGPCLVVAWALVRARRKRFAPFVGALLMATLAMLAVGRGLDFATSEALFGSNVALEPENALAVQELGHAHLVRAVRALGRGDDASARSHAARTVALEERALELYARPGLHWGEPSEAERWLGMAREIAGR